VPEAINLIWRLSVLAELAVVVRLLLQGLGAEYPALLTACCIIPIKSLVLMFSYSFITHDQAREISRNLRPVEWTLNAWIVFELFSRWTRSYVGIGRFGKLLMAALLVIALTISVAFWPVEWKGLVFRQDYRVFYILNRAIWVQLALFLMGTWFFFRNYPVSIASNVARYTYIAVVYFSLNALSELTFTINGLKFMSYVNLTNVTSTTACFFAWAVFLARRGQEPVAIKRVSQKDTERIERINRELLVFMGTVPSTTTRLDR